MEQENGLAESMTSIIEEPNALLFASRKEWKKMNESDLDELSNLQISLAFEGTSSMFFLLQSICPFEHPGQSLLLLKISFEDAGAYKLSTMNLSAVEAAPLLQKRITLWE